MSPGFPRRGFPRGPGRKTEGMAETGIFEKRNPMKFSTGFFSSAALLGAVLFLQACALPTPEEFHPRAYPGPKGELLLSSPFPGFLVIGDKDDRVRFRLHGEKGVFPAPAGKWRVESVGFRAKDGKGLRWEVVSRLLEQDRPLPVDLRPGGKKRLDLGFPLVGKVVAHRKGAHYYSFDPRLFGRGGESYFLRCLDKKPSFPGFRIFTASGKVLKEDRFTFG